jgi:DNA-binding transcriptional ArsR family regulator
MTTRLGRPRRKAAVDVYSAIADPSRRRIVELLADRRRSVNDVAQAFVMSRPAVSKHLRVLKDAGVVTDVVVGRERLYCLQPEPLNEVTEWITTYQRFWRERLARLGRTTRRLADERDR